ncbi:MAG: zf-HC2 domain-containing protein, partial [Candidatus Sumerlaeota bacterium]|nr:zf-HC2 domain-containing protein [Candidatus Sumerlaeota bacterium]
MQNPEDQSSDPTVGQGAHSVAKCREDLLPSFIEGKTTPEETRWVKAHLRRCAWRLLAMSDVRDALAEPTPPLPEAEAAKIREAVLEALRQEKARERTAVVAAAVPAGRLSRLRWAEGASQRRAFRYAAAAAVLLAVVPIFAYVADRVWLHPAETALPAPERPQFAEASAPRAPRPSSLAGSVAPSPERRPAQSSPVSSPLLPGSDRDLDQHIAEAVARADVEAMLPHTEEQYEAWARREYPHVMWLYDILNEDCGYTGNWRDLLVGSGVIYSFDWSTSLEELNVRPRLQHVQLGAMAAGFRAELAADGAHLLPPLAWADLQAGTSRPGDGNWALTFVPVEGDGAESALVVDVEMPRAYTDTIAQRPAVAESILVYFAVSGQLGRAPEWEELSGIARNALQALIAARAQVKGAR